METSIRTIQPERAPLPHADRKAKRGRRGAAFAAEGRDGERADGDEPETADRPVASRLEEEAGNRIDLTA